MSRDYKRERMKDMIGYPLFLIRESREMIRWWMIWDIILFEKFCLRDIIDEIGRVEEVESQ